MHTLRGTGRALQVMTGGAFTQTARDFLARVPNARLLKPFPLEELDKLLAVLLR
jgi:hypothetical protein